MKHLLSLLSLFGFVTGTCLAASPEPGRQVEQQFEISPGNTIPYLLYLPNDYNRSTTRVPLMLFLHGRGESKPPLQTVAKWGPPKLLTKGEVMPWIVASPQCPANESWNQSRQQELLLSLLQHLTKTCRVDTNRLYLTGLSMGGFGSWRLAADHPELFAAVVPICGGGNPLDAMKLVNLPIWVFHGVADPTVPLQRSTEMVEAIVKAGSTRIRFTTLEQIGHNSWEAAYASPDLYQWLAKQSLTSGVKVQ